MEFGLFCYFRDQFFYMIRLTAVVALMLTLSSVTTWGQLSNEERKAWKRQAKVFTKKPETLKELSDQKTAALEEVARLKDTNEDLTAGMVEKDSKLAELEEQLSRMRVDAATARAELERIRNGLALAEAAGKGKGKDQKDIREPKETREPAQSSIFSAGNSPEFNVGIVFRVQIGAFKQKDLSKYFDNNPNFGGEVGRNPNEPQRITIGVFRSYWEADTFKKYMREMGVKDAWIVSYRDGKRVDIKDVLDAIVTEKPSN